MSENADLNPELEIRLNHRILGRMPSLFAHNLIIQTFPEWVVISFFETILPPKAPLLPEDREQLKEVGLLSECIARVTMSRGAFVEAARVMGEVSERIVKEQSNQES